jgi:hypothetical protein
MGISGSLGGKQFHETGTAFGNILSVYGIVNLFPLLFGFDDGGVNQNFQMMRNRRLG